MKRVYVDAVADLFHMGHLNLFKRAKNEGDFLIVGIHSDKTVKSYKRTPIIEQEQRYEIVRACKYVDEVIEDAPLIITQDFMVLHNIDLVIHGDDRGDHFGIQHGDPLKVGKMKYLPYTKGISTSIIIERIINRKE